MCAAVLVTFQLDDALLLALSHLGVEASPPAYTTAQTPFVGAGLGPWVLHQPCELLICNGQNQGTTTLQRMVLSIVSASLAFPTDRRIDMP
jgi:hypothetical protein